MNINVSKFNTRQMSAIRLGLAKGLDVSIYAKPEFNGVQMLEIMSGLEKGLDVSIYANPKFSSLKMGLIRIGLEEGLDVSLYARPELSTREAKRIFYELQSHSTESSSVTDDVSSSMDQVTCSLSPVQENYMYPVILKQENDGVLITIPDFGKIEKVKTEPLKVAHELIGSLIADKEKQGEPIPAHSSEYEIEVGKNETIVYVHIWMPYFRKAQKETYVKKTLTIPDWLDQLAKEKDVNFSAILVKGLKKELGIDD